MRKDSDRLIYGYEKHNDKIGQATEEFQQELEQKCRELSAPDFSSMIQVHGNTIITAQPDRIHPDCDGLITDQVGLMLFGSFADCLPIYVWDQTKPLIGLAHAGWKGTAGRIAQNLVKQLIDLGATDLHAMIGPGICRQHYQVSAGFDLEAKPISHRSMLKIGNHYFFDLYAENQAQLEVYLKPDAIEISPICTYEDGNYYSYRRDQKTRGRNLGYIMLK